MKGVNDFLYAQGRIDLSRALPVGDAFFYALTEFRDSIYNYIAFVRGQDGQGYVTLQGMDGRGATDFPKDYRAVEHEGAPFGQYVSRENPWSANSINKKY